MTVDKLHNTPLHIAAFNGHLPVFKHVVEQLGLNPDLKGHSGKTPLLMASAGGHFDLVQ